MTPKQAREAAGLLRAARRAVAPAGALPEPLRPGDLAAAYAVQAAFLAGPGPEDPALKPVGYKLACTSPKAQAAMGVDAPLTGRLLAGAVYDSPAVLPAGDFLFRLIEPEFAFRLGRGLPRRARAYHEAEVAEAVASLHPAFEIVSSGYGEPAWWEVGATGLVADNAVHGALVLGPGTTDWRGLDLPAHRVSLSVNGEAVSEGLGANTLGGPLTALTWLANRLAAPRDGDAAEGGGSGPPLAAGDLITTGLVTDFKILEAGDAALADFGSLGQVGLRFES